MTARLPYAVPCTCRQTPVANCGLTGRYQDSNLCTHAYGEISCWPPAYHHSQAHLLKECLCQGPAAWGQNCRPDERNLKTSMHATLTWRTCGLLPGTNTTASELAWLGLWSLHAKKEILYRIFFYQSR